jgi:hypothetical protein
MLHVHRILRILALVLLACTLSAAERTWTEAKNTNRPGYDMARIVMEPGQKKLCVEACKDNPICRAYTWVEPGVQEPKPVCWLKSAVPDAKPSTCCTSGARLSDQRFEGTFEPGVDLPGNDYHFEKLAVADPLLCQAACGNDEGCQAFTYVEPGQQGPDAMCYLKDSVPTRKLDEKCCTSGVKASTLVLIQRHPDTDMNGSDYENSAVETGGWQSCHQACADDAQCHAYTYVKSTDVASGGRCWLKNAQPAGRPSACCDSARKLPADQATNIGKGGSDLPGHDYRHFAPRAANDSARNDVCRKACGADSKCLAYTYVKPGVQGADAACWLKNRVPEKGVTADCCSSGTRKSEFTGKPVGSGYVPPILYFSANDPKRVIRGYSFPADMPAPNFPAGYAGCSAGEIEAVEAAWAIGHHHLWRAQQVMQHINVSNRRGDLWTHGYVSRMKDGDFYANWSPRAWFGSYEPRRFRLSRRAVDKVWNERFLGGKVDQTAIKVWCRKDTGVAPCTGSRDGAHTGVGTLDVCPAFFRNRNDSDNAQFIVHELFHWLKIPKSALWVSDSHDFWRTGCRYRAAKAVYNDDAAYIGMNGGCYDWNFNRAVLTNDNYAWFAHTLGDRIYRRQMLSFPAESFD